MRRSLLLGSSAAVLLDVLPIPGRCSHFVTVVNFQRRAVER
jgi:hypothetical protein